MDYNDLDFNKRRNIGKICLSTASTGMMDQSYSDYNDDLSNTPNGAHETIKTTDRLLPIANISKIMKISIPDTAKVAKDAKELMQRSASEFIAIITCMAKDICASENRKTVTGDDLIRSMKRLGMYHYAETARKFFMKYKNMGRPLKIKADGGVYTNFDEITF
ncbi:Nuclear transcription factor Y subunit B-8 [Dictyocoela roeselum]|nr:Nuclear transcription factor Y subunit B-8 [Dictyocoela roeselum]